MEGTTMYCRKTLFAGLGVLALAVLTAAPGFAQSRLPVPQDPPPTEGIALTPMEMLGRGLFFDTNLSTPAGQSCAACHAPEVGFTGPTSAINDATAVYPGAIATRFGNRKPPTAAYAGDSPLLYYDATEEVWIGGMFWDGRATGWTLGDPLAEQAQGPFLNPLEQNMAGAMQVCASVRNSEFAGLFEQVWGPGSLDCSADLAGTYERIARSISAYEKSAEVNPFSSRYDAFLRKEVKLTREERLGLRLFEGKAMCSACHVAPLFTDFTYDNLGVPSNPDNPFYTADLKYNPDGYAWVDYGLGGFLMNAGYGPAVFEPELGKQKVPTLRNVDLRPYDGFVKAYGHNGYFKSLESIVHFYNTRDVLPVCGAGMVEGVDCWPAPEVGVNVNTDELGNLGLTAEEEAALVAFMKMLSDGYRPAR
ncbi:MAG TPA: cytochrome c peroxidase [Candidatus Polarisedimenticolia bacterium]|nr:cytochrome c peroxidase [Candidatus Polarisedimenticolia bacterium]